MRKNEDIVFNPVKSKKKMIKSHIYKSIIKMNDEKMTEFSKENINKTLKLLNDDIKKNDDKIKLTKMEAAIKKINNTRHYNMEYEITIRKLEDKNVIIMKKIEHVKSGDQMNDYILETCQLVNRYLELEEEEKSLIIMEDEIEDIEQKLYEINYLKNNITDDYMKVIDPNYTSRRNLFNNKDALCDNCNIILEISHGSASCSQCGAMKQCLQHPTELSYKEQQEMDYRSQFTYQKETHLDDWIRRFTAKEHKNIPQDVLDKVIMEAKKERVTNLNNLTEEKVKKYLKKLELNEFYDNVISIINRINKRPPFILTIEIETKIKKMFQQIQAPFEKYKTVKRKNMLSYSYILHKFFQILDLPEFSRYFFLLKSPEKLRQQDEIFKKIVEELSKTDPKTNWRFYPSC